MKKILFFFSLVFSFSAFSDNIEQIKASILSDCDTLDSRIAEVRTYAGLIDDDASVGVAYSRQLYNMVDTYSTLTTQQKQYIQGQADNWKTIDEQISSKANYIKNMADALTPVVSSIRTAANSLTTSTNGTCNCDLTPVINAINDFKTINDANWSNFFDEWYPFADDISFLRTKIQTINSYLFYIDESLSEIRLYVTNQLPIINQTLQSIKGTLESIDDKLDDFDIDIGTNLTVQVDFTEIITRLDTIISVQGSISVTLSNIQSSISELAETLSDTKDIVSGGFGSVTNLLYAIQTNLFKATVGNYYPLLASEKNTYLMLGNSLTPSLRDWSSYSRTQGAFTPTVNGVLNSMYKLDYIRFLELSSLNNYFYDFSYKQFPIFAKNSTNTLLSIHRDQTNYFSFFRGELGVQGALADWTNVESDGTYHDFLTNHYINVVRGGSLSGNLSSKTNWFSRIETLLASLVFLDSSKSNAYDSASQSVSNSISNVENNFKSVLNGVSSSGDSQMTLASEIEKSMYDSLRSFSKAFSDASLPSSVRLVYVYKSSGSRSSLSSGAVDATVPVEGKLRDFIEIIRSATTLCWVFFGLWFMFKFSVWTVKKIYMLIRYVIDFFNMVAGGK